jgi:hypothetical protein
VLLLDRQMPMASAPVGDGRDGPSQSRLARLERRRPLTPASSAPVKGEPEEVEGRRELADQREAATHPARRAIEASRQLLATEARSARPSRARANPARSRCRRCPREAAAQAPGRRLHSAPTRSPQPCRGEAAGARVPACNRRPRRALGRRAPRRWAVADRPARSTRARAARAPRFACAAVVATSGISEKSMASAFPLSAHARSRPRARRGRGGRLSPALGVAHGNRLAPPPARRPSTLGC